MSDDLSTIKIPVASAPGKYQWFKEIVTGADDKVSDRTDTFGVPHLMPGVTILVHGVNSDSEWNCIDRDYSGVIVGTGRCA